MNRLKRINAALLLAILAVSISAEAGAQTLSDALSKGEDLALSAGVGGQVAEVLVQAGDHVEKGQLLVKLGSKTYQSRVDATRAALDSAKFKLQLLDEDYARQEELYDEGSLSAVELQLLDLKLKQARSALAGARAAVDVAAANLYFTNVFAPVDGEITAVPMVGQRVNVNAGLPVLIKMKLR